MEIFVCLIRKFLLTVFILTRIPCSFNYYYSVLMPIQVITLPSLQAETSTFLYDELYIQNISKLLSNFIPTNDTNTDSGTQVSCGNSHAGFILHNQVFMWTTSKDHVLSPNLFIVEDMHPLTVPLLSFLHIKVLEIVCGMNHSIVRTSFGLYSWGDNSYGQLGLGDRNKRQLPIVIDSLSSCQIISIACGENHSLVIDIFNRVFAFGDNCHGQLGNGTKDPYQTVPVALPIATPIVQVCGGSMHSVLLAADGAVYAMGSNSYGQLGVPGVTECSEPVRVESLNEFNVKAISSGAHTCIACGRNTSQLWIWGKSIGKQHSENDKSDGEDTPLLTMLDLELEVGDQLREVVIGMTHCLLLTKNGLILSWGSNQFGQCGIGTYSDQAEPKMLPINMTAVRFISVSAHMNMSAAIDSKNRCFVWGSIYPHSAKPIPQSSPNASLVHPTEDCDQTQPECSNLPALIKDIHPEWDTSILTEPNRDGVNDLNIPDFPDFSCLGTLTYGIEALESVLRELYTFYSVARIGRLCHSMNNQRATAILMEMKGDIPRALEFRFRHLVQTCDKNELLNKIIESLYVYLDNLINRNQGAHTSRPTFLNQTLLLIKSTYHLFSNSSLPFGRLEDVFASRIESLTYPLYLFIQETIEEGNIPPLSLTFCAQVTKLTLQKIASGHPDPCLVLQSKDYISKSLPVTEETIWGHVIHNVTKDVEGGDSFQLENNKVQTFYASPEEDEMVLFSCGHFYSGHEFDKTVLPKFKTLLEQNLPSIGKQAGQRIIQHYASETRFKIGCPACVFINLQQIAVNS